MDITIVIVTFNAAEHILNCLTSLYTNPPFQYSLEIIVVDNASADATVTLVHTVFPQVQIICNPQNKGLSYAWNVGFRHARGRYTLFLNSDITVEPGAIDSLALFLDAHHKVGVVGPQFFLDSEKKAVQITCTDVYTPQVAFFRLAMVRWWFPDHPAVRQFSYAGWNRDSLRQVDAVCGAAFMIRREALESIGLFDEGYFLYFEEHDLSEQLRGIWETYYLPEAQMIHLHEKTTRRFKSLSRRAARRSFFRFFDKYYGRATAIGLTILLVASTPFQYIESRWRRWCSRQKD